MSGTAADEADPEAPWQVVFTRQAQKDAVNLAGADLRPKAEVLLAVPRVNSFQTPPPYEKLRGDLAGTYSRRLNIQHRLIYQVEQEMRIVKISQDVDALRMKERWFMPFRRRMRAVSIVGTALACLGGSAGAEDLKAAYQAQVGWTLHLLETGRYGEAEDAAQNLVTAYPDAALPYELRGTTALYVGSVGRAQADFSHAAETAKDPAGQYGLALCALYGQKVDAASDALAQVGQDKTLSEGQAGDLETAQAYVRYLKGDFAGAQVLAVKGNPADGSLRAEVAALAAYRLAPKSGVSLLTQFLQTDNGVPRVCEQEGLRPLFESASPAVEPAVIETDLQAMYADRLAGNLADAKRHTGDVQTCSGKTALTAPANLPASTTLVSFSVDGQMEAMVNQPPYTFDWNTAHIPNGTHTIRVDAIDSYGNTVSSETQTVRVVNRNAAAAPAGSTDDPATTALKTRLWKLLQLRPCRKVAEWTLGQAALAAGDRVSADAHLANAAALDPAYKDGRRFARALFGFPAATIAHVASAQPLSLWTGNASRKEIALTFDDGPNPAKTPALLDALDKVQAPATFFVVGSRAEQAPDILRRMAERGDEVENHSYTHPNMNIVVPSVAESEMLRTSVLIRAMTGHQPHFFRPPGGNANPSVQYLSRVYGLSLAYWTIDALHYEDIGSSRGLIDYVVSHAHPGSIVLLHNGTDVTTASVPALVAALRARGYKLVTLSEIAQGKTAAKPAAMPKMRE